MQAAVAGQLLTSSTGSGQKAMGSCFPSFPASCPMLGPPTTGCSPALGLRVQSEVGEPDWPGVLQPTKVASQPSGMLPPSMHAVLPHRYSWARQLAASSGAPNPETLQAPYSCSHATRCMLASRAAPVLIDDQAKRWGGAVAGHASGQVHRRQPPLQQLRRQLPHRSDLQLSGSFCCRWAFLQNGQHVPCQALVQCHLGKPPYSQQQNVHSVQRWRAGHMLPHT